MAVSERHSRTDPFAGPSLSQTRLKKNAINTENARREGLPTQARRRTAARPRLSDQLKQTMLG
jgi:hypothetical protein